MRVVFLVGVIAGCDGDGANGADAMIRLADEPAGANCPDGGTKIEAGRDKNRNGELASSEVESTSYSCHGATGDDGEPGEGEPGDAGKDGHSALVVTSTVAAGAACVAGGQRVDQGIDRDDDGELTGDEISSTATICNGVDGDTGVDGTGALVNVTVEAAGANCAAGGQKVDSGLDADGDGQLAASEVDKTSYFCNGADGEAGLDSVAKVTAEAAGANCPAGGLRIDLGLDDDDDGALDEAEIDSTSYACDGADGADGAGSLVSVVDEAAGANCAAGGEKITYGLDLDADDTLDSEEIVGTRYACDGVAGADGVEALVKLTAITAGATCAYGGQRIDSGRDDDANGTLEAGEIDSTTNVCNGSP